MAEIVPAGIEIFSYGGAKMKIVSIRQRLFVQQQSLTLNFNVKPTLRVLKG